MSRAEKDYMGTKDLPFTTYTPGDAPTMSPGPDLPAAPVDAPGDTPERADEASDGQCEAGHATLDPLCDGCGCCWQCCNCAETDCDCDVCLDRREHYGD